jgi:hypothetical protein
MLSGGRHRILKATLAGVMAVALAVVAPTVMSAGSRAASAATVPTHYLTHKGGTVTWTITVHNAKPAWCAWSSSPKVAKFGTTVRCKTGKVTRSAQFKANTSAQAKSYAITLTVLGKSRTVDRWKVIETGQTAPTTTTTSTTTTSTTTTTPQGPVTTFGAGTYVVGTGIVAGTYRSTGGPSCYWARVSGFGGTLGEILANDLLSGPTVVTIAASDAGFQSSGCGTWSPLPASGPQSTSFGDGVFAVGIDIASGTYSAPGGPSCYWARVSGFGGTLGEIITNDLPTGPVVVTIQASDVGFKAQGCGSWTHQ